jgi:ribose-phosphate pyrophosphokinase
VAEWIQAEIERPLLVGPDSESGQWVADVARRASAPYVVLEKTRRGDRDVEVSVPDVERWRDRRPVLVDDIISTARTMIETVRRLKSADLPAPICVGVHAVFAGDAYRDLRAAGAERVVTTNTIAHESNQIDVSAAVAAAVGRT